MKLNRNTYKKVTCIETSLRHVAVRMAKAPSPWERVGVRLSVRVFGLFVVCLSLLLTACTQAEMMFRQVVADQGLVHIRPDMSVHTLPAQKYYFYNANGTTACQQFLCDGSGNFSGSLSAGSYRVIASNSTATGAVYKNMDAYEAAMVCADNLYTRSASQQTRTRNSNVTALGKVYRVVPEPFTVYGNDTIYHTPTPELLTRTLTLSFSLSSELQSQVIALSGTLPGVYPSVHLATGKTIESEIARAPELSLNYIANQLDSHWTASINLFGLCDPKYGQTYQNVATVVLETEDTTHTVQVDLTESLSDMLENYEGNLPIDIPVQINIELELIDIEVAGTVTSWSYVSGGTEIVVPI